jgi:ATP-dependent RNA helicase RhlE
MTFQELGLAPHLVSAVDRLGYAEPTPIQRMAIPLVLEGRDVLGRAQTGTGKTAAFILPILHRLRAEDDGTRALVLCPTRELAIQVSESARSYAAGSQMYIGVVYGGVPLKNELRDLRAGFDLMVATPGRLIDHLERGNIDLSGVQYLVLDEADRMLDMGFRPQINEILRRIPKQRQTLLFSATMPNAVKSLAYESLQDPVSVEAAPHATTAEGVEQTVYPVDKGKKPELLIELLSRPGMESVIVFTRTKIGADKVYARLKSAKISAALMHGDRDMKERVSALEGFRSGDVRVLVATDVAQRGLDVEGISHVVNYDTPQDPDSYVHRVGRTARAGLTGHAVTFMSPAEIGDVRSIEIHIGRDLPRVELPGFGWGDATEETVSMPARHSSRPQRGGRRRMGSLSERVLSPEELDNLLKIS